MLQEKNRKIKIKKCQDIIKQRSIETLKLMKNFKWVIGFYIFYFVIILICYFNPPAVDDPIWGAEAVRSAWEYTNQAVYLGSLEEEIRFSCVLFLLASSNMHNHPTLARILFLYPVFISISSLVTEIFFY